MANPLDGIKQKSQEIREKTNEKLQGSDNPIAKAIVEEENEAGAELENVADLVTDFKQEIRDEKAELELTEDLEQRLEQELAPDLLQLEQHEEELAEIIEQTEIHNQGGLFAQADLSPEEIKQKFRQLENDVENIHQDTQEVRKEFEKQTEYIRKEDQEFEKSKQLFQSLINHENRTEQLMNQMEQFAQEQGRNA